MLKSNNYIMGYLPNFPPKSSSSDYHKKKNRAYFIDLNMKLKINYQLTSTS